MTAAIENVADIYPLSPLQQGMLFHTLAAPGSGVYVEQYTCTLNGRLDAAAFRDVWQAVVDRHPILRSAFVWEGLDEPLQVVRERVALPWSNEDWSDLAVAERQRRVGALLREDRARGFDLSAAPLMRMKLLRAGVAEHRFIWSFHHLLGDGWSTALLLREVFERYAHGAGAGASSTEPRPFRDYIAWLQDRGLSGAERFWKEYLRGFTGPAAFPEARPAGSAAGPADQQELRLTAAETAALQDFARTCRLTVNTVVQGAWAILLGRYAARDDVVYGVTVSGRPPGLRGVERMIGPFINTLPSRTRLDASAPLTQWLQQLQRSQVEMREWEHTPLARIQEWSELGRGRSLFDSILVFENYPLDAGGPATSAGLDVRDVEYREQSNYPLALLVVPEAQLRLIAVHESARLGAAAAARLLAQLRQLLTAFTADPSRSIGDYDPLPSDERHLVLEEWSGTRAEVPAEPVHEAFERQTLRTPDATALVCGDARWTYHELNDRAERLARYLRALGVGANVRVGLCVERSPELLVGILGILKAGGAYVALDPEYPEARLRYMLEDAAVPLVLTRRRLAGVLPDGPARLVFLDEPLPEVASNGTPPARVRGDDLAYLIYTSGSTGKPKGVEVGHANLAHSTCARALVYPEPPARFLLLSSFSFDSSAVGLFWPLCSGGALILPGPHEERDPHRVLGLIAEHQVTHTLCLPSLYGLLLEHAAPRSLRSLRVVIVAGEACSAEVARTHVELLPWVELYNEYGPTEATVWSTVHRVPREFRGTRVPIGRPIPNTRAYVLDACARPVPIGVPGELYLGGPGIARGYHDRPDATSERFVADPFAEGGAGRLYRTGDLVRWSGSGELEYLGRIDRQLKVRGHRIEPDEIEALLAMHPAVRESVVVARAPEQDDSSESLWDRLALLDPADAEMLLAEVETLANARLEVPS